MKTHAFRLTNGQDLKQEIVTYCKENKVEAGYICSLVGCLYEVNIRLAGAEKFFHKEEDFEIVSATGTLSMDGVHIHLSVSDCKGQTFGGHLSNGCYINTTCEVILCELDEYTFNRKHDEITGYKELIIRAKE